jgi:exodeoxyribonuclease VII small subunit
MAEDEAAADLAGVSFEKALAELEDIVGKLEKGNVPLEESIALYERGAALKRHCDRLLEAAEQRVEKITAAGPGQPVGTEPLDGE